ncbi:MAG: ABC transporter ATP-binding protein [Verrucomicrobiota bacterium]|nr:ABC transporter ATP-binding protein [Verrucomicrobiota bacterium]
MIEARDLKKSFGSLRVLDGVTFKIEKGESVVIIGRSGSGKSILLKHLIGLLPPDSGAVWVKGQNISAMDERELIPVRHQFGMLFQSAALFDSMTVAENISFALRREGKLNEPEITQRVRDVLEMVELAETEDKKPAELSGGMRKRVGLARAIVYKPEILLYDEPTTGLDPIASDRIDQLIIRVVEKLKVTSIVVTHDMRSARRVGQRILMLHEGKIHISAPPEEIFKSEDPIVHRFVNGISERKEPKL